MSESLFIPHGIFELIAASVTVLGILLALDKRIIDNYQEMLEIQENRKTMLDNGITKKFIDRFDTTVDELFNNINVGMIRLIEGQKDYKYRHMLITMAGIGVLLAYGLSLITEEFKPSFFWSSVVIMGGMCPTIIHLLIHRNLIMRALEYIENTNYQFVQLQDALKATDPETSQNKNG